MKINIAELINQGKLPALPNTSLNYNINYFNLFDLDKKFDLNSAKLKKAYLDIQNIVHPDKFMQKGTKHQTIALEWATFANEAFNNLNNIAKRAIYWCKLHNINTNIQVEMHILEQTIDWHESLQNNLNDDENKKSIKLQAKKLMHIYEDKFKNLSIEDESNNLLGQYAQTLLLVDRFLHNI